MVADNTFNQFETNVRIWEHSVFSMVKGRSSRKQLRIFVVVAGILVIELHF